MMNEPSSLLNDLSEDAVWRLEEVCCRFEKAWQAGQRPRLKDFLEGAEGVERLALLRELLRLDVHYRRRADEVPAARDYATDFPDASTLLSAVFPVGPEDGDAPPAPGAESTTDDADGKPLGAALLRELVLLEDKLPEAERAAWQQLWAWVAARKAGTGQPG